MLQKIREKAELLGIDRKFLSRSLNEGFSGGEKKRLALALVLLDEPELLILDEPTNGLDPQGIAEIRKLILNIADQGKTILIASHILDEVQKVCTHFSVLKKGTRIYSGSVKEALNERKTIEVSSRDLRKLCSALKEYKDLLTIESSEDRFNISLNGNSTSHELNTYLIDKGIILTHLAEKKGNLEQKFLTILEEADD